MCNDDSEKIDGCCGRLKVYCHKINNKKLFSLAAILFFIVFLPVLSESAGYDNYWNKAIELQKQKRYKEADILLSRGISNYPRADKLWYLRATNRANNLSMITEAIKDYGMVLKLKPKNFKIYFRRGVWLSKIGQYRSAIRDYNSALAIKPNYFKVYYERARAYAKLNYIEKATNDLNLIIKFDPTYSPAAKRLLGKILAGKKDF